jgi:DNA-binding CsgD family transcriptional regulator/PAS domain-containing protein
VEDEITGIDDLAAAAIRGVTEPAPWSSFVALLRARFGGTHANVIFRRADLEQTCMTDDFAAEVLAQGHPSAFYRAEDDPIPYYRMEPFTAFELREFVGDCPADTHPFIARFMQPLHMDYLLILRVVTGTGLQAWISVTRRTPFTVAERKLLERVGRLLEPALALFGAWKEATEQRDAYARVVRARATGVLRIDQNGKVLDLDPGTAQWIAEEPALSLDNGRLGATAPADRQKLEKALASIVEGRSEEELLALGTGGRTIELLIYRVSEAFEPAWSASPRAIVYLRVGGREALPSPQRIRTLFNLSRREAALAAVLARGLTLGQAAVDLGISEMTARAYLRQIFQKTGVSRQAELIRQVQASVASIH